MSKRLDSRYAFGQRSPHWRKLAHRHRLSYVVGGWRPQEGTSDRLAALLVGEPTPDGLAYRGRVGSGIGGRAGRLLGELLAPRARADSPFVDEVPSRRRPGHPLGGAHGRGRRRHPRHRLRPAAAAVLPRRPRRPDAGGPLMPAKEPYEKVEVLVDVEGRTLRISNLEQGALPAHRHHQGRGAQLLRPDRPDDAAAPGRPRGHPDPMAARRGGDELLREERPRRHAVVGAHRDRARRADAAPAPARASSPSRWSTTSRP